MTVPTNPEPRWPDGYVAVLREAGAMARYPGNSNQQVQQARDALERYYAKFRGIPLEPRSAVSKTPHQNMHTPLKVPNRNMA